MAKKKRPFEGPKPKKPGKNSGNQRLKGNEDAKVSFFRDRGVRETIESIVVAVMLALMFRAYEAEAFVIPTGSMAPTLQGRHLDTECDKCGFLYRTGASGENPDKKKGFVFDSYCPICRYGQQHDRNLTSIFKTNDDSFTGDRILVSKFAYEYKDPERWDVIVFKYPDNPKQNYIKRCVGMPNEILLLQNGDVFTRKENQDEAAFEIQRKPTEKLEAMLQIVDDTDYIAAQLKKAGWPSRWQQWNKPDKDRVWSVNDGERTSYSAGPSEAESWLRYRHIVPRSTEWNDILSRTLPDRLRDFKGELITDYYAYNDAKPAMGHATSHVKTFDRLGLYWVGDLALEARVEVQSDSGSIGFDLVEGGVHFTCWIDVATGNATISNDGQILFGGKSETSTAQTSIQSPGNYRVKFANVDNELTLWVNGNVIDFETPLTFQRSRVVYPVYNGPDDPGDAEPVGIGSKNAQVSVSGLQVLRDVYYISKSSQYFGTREIAEKPEVWNSLDAREKIKSAAVGPDHWGTPHSQYSLEDGQFMPLGDNSPQSADARDWPLNYIDRRMLIGKALFIYWPHAWRPFWPNFRRMRLIY